MLETSLDYIPFLIDIFMYVIEALIYDFVTVVYITQVLGLRFRFSYEYL